MLESCMCLDHEAQMTDPAMQQDMKALLRWEELWRSTLETYSLLALDLPHRQSPEYFTYIYTYVYRASFQFTICLV